MSRSEPLTSPRPNRGTVAQSVHRPAAGPSQSVRPTETHPDGGRRSRLDHWLLYLLVGSSLVLFALWAINPVPCSDLWWQLKTGELIWHERAIPTVDRFSFTAAGNPWIIQEWASEVMFYLLYTKLSASALVLFKMLAF